MGNGYVDFKKKYWKSKNKNHNTLCDMLPNEIYINNPFNSTQNNVN